MGDCPGDRAGGLGREPFRAEAACSYQELPHFPPATSPSHAGRLCWGQMAGETVMLCQGRFHAYEGYTLRQVTFPVRVMAGLGIKTLVAHQRRGRSQSPISGRAI